MSLSPFDAMEIPWGGDLESISYSLIICWPKFVTLNELGNNFELSTLALKSYTAHKNKFKYKCS